MIQYVSPSTMEEGNTKLPLVSCLVSTIDESVYVNYFKGKDIPPTKKQVKDILKGIKW